MESPNELLLLVAVGVGMMLILAVTFVLFFSFSQNKLRQEQIKAQQTKLEYQEKLLHSTLRTQEEERKRIAKDLHDEVGSKLNVIHLFMHQIAKKAPDVRANIDEVAEVLNDTINTSRRISHDLLPPTLESFGLASAIEEFCDRFRQSHTLSVNFESEGTRPENIPQMTELNLFRILQELLSNTLKYAQASEINIHLIQSPEKLLLEYRDNGRGFDEKAMENQKGLGMKNVESRLQMIGGTWHLQTALGEGVKVRVEVKLSPG
ncbi:MAG: sensor histidine kinase [Bacteroidia bacterium]